MTTVNDVLSRGRKTVDHKFASIGGRPTSKKSGKDKGQVPIVMPENKKKIKPLNPEQMFEMKGEMCCNFDNHPYLSKGGNGAIYRCTGQEGLLKKVGFEKNNNIANEVKIMNYLHSYGLTAKSYACDDNSEYVTGFWDTNSDYEELKAGDIVLTVNRYLSMHPYEGPRLLADATYRMAENLVANAGCYHLDITSGNVFVILRQNGYVELKLIDTDPNWMVFPFGMPMKDGPGIEKWKSQENIISFVAYTAMLWIRGVEVKHHPLYFRFLHSLRLHRGVKFDVESLENYLVMMEQFYSMYRGGHSGPCFMLSYYLKTINKAIINKDDIKPACQLAIQLFSDFFFN